MEKGFKDRLERGVVAGYKVKDVCVEVFFGKHHPVDSSEQAFKTAASMAFRNVFQQAKPSLLEPIVKIEVTVPGDKLGDISSDMSGRRGRVLGMSSAGGDLQTVIAEVPLAEVTNYARALSSITGGQGSYTMEFTHYDLVPGNVMQEIIEKAQMKRKRKTRIGRRGRDSCSDNASPAEPRSGSIVEPSCAAATLGGGGVARPWNPEGVPQAIRNPFRVVTRLLKPDPGWSIRLPWAMIWDAFSVPVTSRARTCAARPANCGSLSPSHAELGRGAMAQQNVASRLAVALAFLGHLGLSCDRREAPRAERAIGGKHERQWLLRSFDSPDRCACGRECDLPRTFPWGLPRREGSL